ncbi:MAG: substrate-binding domain-containing protein [Deltaproteobacteria bacterium]|nr:substrate-binding domain-containing protein [Deltaproteobacteria bacterium]
MNRSIIAAFAAVFMLALFPAAMAFTEDNTVTISGDPCSLPLAKALAEEFVKMKKGVNFAYDPSSCTLGVYKASEGKADIGVSTQNGLSENLPKDAVTTVIAKSPVVFIVNKANPVSALTYDQLKGIYDGTIKNWKDVGGADMPILNVMLAPCVKHMVNKKLTMYGKEVEELRPEGKVNPVEYTNKLVMESEAAIGQQIYGYESDDVKILKVDGMMPTSKNVGDIYRFYQDYNIVTKGEPKGVLKEYIDFAFSKKGAKVIEGFSHVLVAAETEHKHHH